MFHNCLVTNQPRPAIVARGVLGVFTLKAHLIPQRAAETGSFCMLVESVFRAKACLDSLELCCFAFLRWLTLSFFFSSQVPVRCHFVHEASISCATDGNAITLRHQHRPWLCHQ